MIISKRPKEFEIEENQKNEIPNDNDMFPPSSDEEQDEEEEEEQNE
jgi:hypothetical protein